MSRSAKVLILSSGQALTALVGIASATVLVRVFSKVDYATYRQTLLCYTFAVPFVTLGFDRALYYFLPGETKRSRGVLIENLLWLTAAGGVLSVFLLAGGNRLLAARFNNPSLAALLLVLVPYPLLTLPALALPACLMARNRTEQIAGFNVGSRLLMLAVIVVPCLIWPTPLAAIVGTVVGASITTAVGLVLMFRACSDGDWRPTMQGLRRQVGFSTPLGVSGLLGSVAGRLDQVLVSLRSSPEVFASYSVGALELPLIGIVTGSISSVVIVDYTRLYKEGRYKEIVNLIHQVMIRSSLLLMPAMVFFFCVAPDAMSVLFSRQYEGSSAVFRVYLLLLPMRTLSYGALLQATGKSRHILYQTILHLAVNACVGWFAVGYFGAIGAAIVMVADTYLTYVPYNLLVLRSVLGCPIRLLFPWSRLIRVVAASSVGAVLLVVMNHYAAHWSAVVRLGLGLALYGSTTLLIFSRVGWLDSLSPVTHLWAVAGFVRQGSADGPPLSVGSQSPAVQSGSRS
jgi:O-antigen/teichoic acid export membrane protein